MSKTSLYTGKYVLEGKPLHTKCIPISMLRTCKGTNRAVEW